MNKELREAVEIEEDFNAFIKKWCGNFYPHLIDSDGNDGERFRDKLRILISCAERVLKAEVPGKKNWTDNMMTGWATGWNDAIDAITAVIAQRDLRIKELEKHINDIHKEQVGIDI